MPDSSLQAALDALIPPTVIPLLHQIGEEGEKRGAPVFLVGGVVRDLLLEAAKRAQASAEGNEYPLAAPPERNADLDLVAEGDAIPLAQRLGPLLGAKVKAHERFGTATLEFPDGSHIDLTTARRERYPKPGALPIVEFPASLEDDLFRRDFTLNAMAIRLGEPFGTLEDPYTEREDLRLGKLRILHPASFVDDPTRIMRGARFEARFGFRMEPETRRLADEAVCDGRLGTVSKDRFRRELTLGLQESSPWECAERWDDLGVLHYLHPDLTAHPERLRQVFDTLRWYAALRQKETPDRTLLYLAELLSPLPPDEARLVCEQRLGLPNPKTELLTRCLSRGPELAESVPDLDPSALTKALKSEKLEVLLFAALLAPGIRETLAAYLQNYRHLKLGVTGDDLIVMGCRAGPEMGRALQAALDQKLRGKLKTRKKELDFILKQLNGC